MQMMKVCELVPHPRNNEFFDDLTGERWAEFLESVKTSGVIEPVVVTEDKVIISGHQRVRACKELGIEEIPVEVKLYEGDDKKVVKDLIETNVRQRGTIGGSDQQIVARVEALKEWYDIGKGKLGNVNRTNGTISSGEDMCIPDKDMRITDLLGMLGLTERQYKTAQKIATCAIPEVQQLIENGTVSRRTVADLIAKLSPEDQRKLLDKLPDDVKFTAKSIEKKIEEIRAEGTKNANAVQQQKDKLEAQIDSLRRECNELRAGNLPVTEDTLNRLKEKDDQIREYYEKYQKSEEGKAELRKMLKEYNDEAEAYKKQLEALKAASSGNDDGVVALQCEIDELNKRLSAAETRAKGLEGLVEEKEDQINDLLQKRRDGGLRAAVTPENGSDGYAERELQNLVSKIQIAVGSFMSSVKEILDKAENISMIDTSMLLALGETSGMAIHSAESLNRVILAAGGGGDQTDEVWSEDDMIATGVSA